MKTMLSVAMLFTLGAIAAEPAAAPQPKLNEMQQLKLENASLRLKAEYAAFQTQLAAFQTTCAQIVKEIGLPEGTSCNPETVTINMPPAHVPKQADGQKEKK